jgi:hypothetical protein
VPTMGRALLSATTHISGWASRWQKVVYQEQGSNWSRPILQSKVDALRASR